MLTALTLIEAREIQQMAHERAALQLPDEFWLSPDDSTVMDAETTARWHLLTDRIVERIRSLSDGARIELLALTWLGGGDDTDNWRYALGHAQLNDNIGTARYLASKGTLEVHIEKGLRMIGAN